jgi:endonuclease/exonuclease/phosphatase family metal-dependent hydrolase
MAKKGKYISIYRAIIKNIFLVINLLFVVFYIFAMLSTVVPPDNILMFSYFGLVFPVLLIINLCFMIFWLFRKKLYWLISLCVVLFSFNHVNNCFSIPFKKLPKNHCYKEITLLSYNVSAFGSTKNIGETLNFIDEVNADIICFQEFGFWGKKNSQVLQWLADHYPYNHICYKNQSKLVSWGVATFSKYPIIEKVKIDYESKYNSSIYSDIVIENDTIRVINNHLESNKFTIKDLRQYQDLKYKLKKDNILNISSLLSHKLGLAYKIRAKQTRKVADVVKTSPYKTIACGDFNDVPESYAYYQIKCNLINLYSATSWGYHYSFRQKGMWVAIDHILVDKNLLPISMEVPKKTFSDHLPLVGKFGIKYGNF